MERKTNERKREPSRLALELADAFAPFAQWSEVRVERGAKGRRTRVIDGPAGGAIANGGTDDHVSPTPFRSTLNADLRPLRTWREGVGELLGETRGLTLWLICLLIHGTPY